MNDKLVLEVNALTKSYSTSGGSLTVLRDVTFGLGESRTCAIVGPSGSGKTTLLGLCAGLDQPTSGTVHLNGIGIHGMNEDGRAQLRSLLIGFVFQNFQLLSTLTARENVMVPVELRGDSDADDLAIELLDRVGLADRMDHYPVQLSGGEQQRVALARAFINRPKILFADEPTGNLDSDTSGKVIDLLFDLNRAAGTALVLVTHNLELASMTDCIIKLRGGKMVGSL